MYWQSNESLDFNHPAAAMGPYCDSSSSIKGIFPLAHFTYKHVTGEQKAKYVANNNKISSLNVLSMLWQPQNYHHCTECLGKRFSCILTGRVQRKTGMEVCLEATATRFINAEYLAMYKEMECFQKRPFGGLITRLCNASNHVLVNDE